MPIQFKSAQIDLYNSLSTAGHTQEQVARALVISHSGLRYAIADGRLPPWPQRPRLDKEEMLKLRKEGVTQTEIAAYFKCSKAYVSRLAMGAGLAR